MTEDGPRLHWMELGYTDAEAERAARNGYWRSFLRGAGLKPSEAEWEAGRGLPPGDYVWNGRRWRRVALLRFPESDLPDLDVGDDYPGESDETLRGVEDVPRGFVLEYTGAEIVVAIPVEGSNP